MSLWMSIVATLTLIFSAAGAVGAQGDPYQHRSWQIVLGWLTVGVFSLVMLALSEGVL